MNNKMKRAGITCLLLGAIILAPFFVPLRPMAAPGDTETNEMEENEKPTVSAFISEQCLTIQAKSEKGIKAVYVNGYEFANSGNGNLKIRLQQFDSGYQKFFIYAEDLDGVASEIYELENPYFDENKEKQDEKTAELPENANPTDETTAVGEVTEHFRNGSREFYTIKTQSGKTFYLILDLGGEKQTVYFLTEISENDLLNVTGDNKEVLPRNSLVSKDYMISGTKSSNVFASLFLGKDTDSEQSADQTGTGGSMRTYLFIGAVGIVVIIIFFLRKSKNKKSALKKGKERREEEDDEE